MSVSSVFTAIDKFRAKYLSKKYNGKYQTVGSNQSDIDLKQCDDSGSDLDLIDFLDNNADHYHQFADYLDGCFAIENLKFLQCVVVYRGCLSSWMERGVAIHSVTQSDCVEHDNPFLRRLFHINLGYLKALNKEYSTAIHSGQTHEILSGIYEQFVSPSSEDCINISWSAREKLVELFKQPREQEGETSIEEMSTALTLFDEAILEIYTLLDIRYSTEFAKKSKA